MKKISLERDRILKIWKYENNTILIEVGLKNRWKKSSHDIGFFSEKKRMFEELPRYFKDDELKRLKTNDEFLQAISILQ